MPSGRLKGYKMSEAHKKANAEGHLGKKASIETRLKMSKSAKKRVEQGNHNFWKGGVSKENRSERLNIMSTFEYKIIREACFKRDSYTCIWCGDRSGKGKKVILHADHIKPFSLFPELRFALDNLRTLCASCHRKTETYGGFSRTYKPIK